MVSPILVLLASSFVVAAAPPLRLVQAKKAFAVPLFHPPTAASRALGLPSLRATSPGSATTAPFVCHIIVIKPDPRIDPKMAVEVTTEIDPKIVRKSGCAESPKD